MDKVLIVTATKVEAEEVLGQFSQASGTAWKRCFIGRKTYYTLGNVGGVDLYMVQSQMGSGTPGGALLTVSEAIRELKPAAVIMVGICFGVDSEKQRLGDILVSRQIHAYEPRKVTDGRSISRGDKITASEDLLDKFQSGTVGDWTGARVCFGLILSGETLVNDPIFRQELLKTEPEAIGGEMEGAGLYTAARYAAVDWIIVKAICDWADGKKNDEHQQTAAKNAAAFVLHVIQQGGMKYLRLSGKPENSVSPLGRIRIEEKRSAVRSTIPSRYGKPFIGRVTEQAEMLRILNNTSREMILVLHGPSGSGKSELGFEFARTQQSRYPGGTFLLRGGSTGPSIDLAGIGEKILGLKFAADLDLEGQCLETLRELEPMPTLLVCDNVMSLDEIKVLLPPTGRACHVVITTVVEPWPAGWPIVGVPPLPDEKALDLVEAIGGAVIAQKYGKRLVELSGGLPIQICPLVETLKRKHERGLDKYVEFTLSGEATASFGRVYEALDSDQRLLIHAAARLNSQRIRREHLFRHVLEPAAMDEPQLLAALDACMDVTLLQGMDDLRMHQLMADFLRNISLQQDKLADSFRKVRQVQKEHLVELANQFLVAPADANLAAELAGFPLSVEAWRDVEASFSGEQERVIGDALRELGRCVDALPWLERAVDAHERGDIDGKVEHSSLGEILHRLAFCYVDLDRFKEALPWLERAVDAKQRGDLDGRVDHTSMGRTLHEMGLCYAELGRFKEALPWLERAIDANERGDIHGRVDQTSLGVSLHQLGYCYNALGRFKEALPWLERAVDAKQRGGIDGKVEHASIGTTFREVGYCYMRLGRLKEALPWLERAVDAKLRGDIYARVDHSGLGTSLHMLGGCCGELRRFKKAIFWYELALEAEEKGDIYGRVDHNSMGRTLHEMGYCYMKLGRFKEALRWFKRAVDAKLRGDIYGKVDEESLLISRDAVDFTRKRLKQLGKR